MRRCVFATILLLAGACSSPSGKPNSGTTNSGTNGAAGESNRLFQAVETSGFTGPVGSCGALDDGEATVRFVLMADDNTTIAPGEAVREGPVTISSESIEFTDSALFEFPDKACQPDGCRLDEMQCGSAPGIDDSAANHRCHVGSSVAPAGEVEFEPPADEHLFGVLYENAGSLAGWLPEDVGRLYPDWDGDGTAEGSDDPGIVQSRASDPTSARAAALMILAANWTTAAMNRNDRDQTTQYGLWEFNGTSQADVVSLVESAVDTTWTTSPDTVESAGRDFSQPSGTRANVYMAINHVLETAYASDEYATHGKTLLVFVDGPDDLRFPRHTVDSVASRAKDLGVRIFIAHLDASQLTTTQAGTPVFRDDPRYWNEIVDGEQIQSPCADDSDCKNFESCRIPRAYSDALNAPVQIDPMGESYCLPDRDPDTGRTGPIAEYARIACETEGGYIYVRDTSGLRGAIDWLPFATTGLWSATTKVEGVANFPDTTALSLQTTMDVTVGGRTTSAEFSQEGDPTAANTGRDTRSVLFR